MSFGDFVRVRHEAGMLVVQPRMGFADPGQMRAGLAATRKADASTVGTITIDSYTRVGDVASAGRALRDSVGLNGYPIASYHPSVTRRMLGGVAGDDFPVQVRHGSACPLDIVRALIAARLHATEGGPVSYCLPYGRIPLAESVRNWAACCDLLLSVRASGAEPHVETFGGCMMGQLCPPSQLVALSVLEALFFYQHGLTSISLSYAQQIHAGQDREAVRALRRLCAELLPRARWHVVIYAFMGLYPRTAEGSRAVLAEAAELAVSTGSERLVVKTVAESHRLPTIAENVAALEYAHAVAQQARAGPAGAIGSPAGAGPADPGEEQIYQEARAFIDAVLNCHPDVGTALLAAFRRGLLDVPYCLHPDNAGRSQSYLDAAGRLGWADIGGLPLAGLVGNHPRAALGSTSFLRMLSFVRDKFDAAPLEWRQAPVGPAQHRGLRSGP